MTTKTMRRSLLLLLLAGCASTQPAPAPAPGPAVAAAPAGAPAAPPAPPAPPEEAVAPRITPDADFRATRPKPGPERAFKVPAVKRFRLKNGLPVILAESHKLPLVG